jgi:hypothetical protein
MSPLDHARRKAAVTCSAPARDEAGAVGTVLGDATAGEDPASREPSALLPPGTARTFTTMAITTAPTTAATAASDAATMTPVRGRRGGPPRSENPAAKASYPSRGGAPGDSSPESPWPESCGG